MNEEQKVFKDREVVNPNRKKFKVIEIIKDENNCITELIVDIEREEQVIEEGTQITAENLNTIIDEIIKWKV